jgi:hypothetical protein
MDGCVASTKAESYDHEFALPHHIHPESGWVSYWIRNSDDIPAVLKLFEIQYERLSKSAMSYPS